MSIIVMIIYLHENTSARRRRRRKCERKKKQRNWFAVRLHLFVFSHLSFSSLLLLSSSLSPSPTPSSLSYLSKHAPIPIPQSRRTQPILLSLGLNFPHFLEKLVNGCVEGYTATSFTSMFTISNQIKSEPSHIGCEAETLMHPINKFSSAFSQSQWRI